MNGLLFGSYCELPKHYFYGSSFISVIQTYLDAMTFNRSRTLGLLDKIEESENSAGILAWRPGPGRAHIAWQLMHIGITEELFATERLSDSTPEFAELIDRFKGGSTPDDQIPSSSEIREVLSQSRAHLEETLNGYSDDALDSIPTEWLSGRGWTLKTTLQVLGWHEAHHQGQAHLTNNLWNAAHA